MRYVEVVIDYDMRAKFRLSKRGGEPDTLRGVSPVRGRVLGNLSQKCEDRRRVLSLHKTVRKYFGEAIVVTQEVDDIISSPVVKESIINNSDCKILLDQRKYMNKFEAIQALLGLTDKEKAQILSINMSNHPGRKYKEVWVGLGGVQSAVYATEVSLPEYYTYTTEETEKLEVQRFTEKLGGDIELAIKQIAADKGITNVLKAKDVLYGKEL